VNVKQSILLILTILVTLTGCASNKGEEQVKQANTSYVDERDPFEEVNRDIWDFNWNVLDKHVLRPIAVGYTKLPQPAQTGVKNFITNLEEPGYALNNLFQGDFAQSGTSAGRFVINTTLGIFGLFDIADYMGLERQKESFGETLAVAGVGNGPYIMVPAYGPTTVRDAAGDLVDGEIFPLYFLTLPQSALKLGIKAIYTRAELIQQEQMINNSTDSYIFIKEAYYQNQNFKIHDGNPPIKQEEQLDEDILDELDEF
jgi:phospholipid-binding lipoprotein MlaA